MKLDTVVNELEHPCNLETSHGRGVNFGDTVRIGLGLWL